MTVFRRIKGIPRLKGTDSSKDNERYRPAWQNPRRCLNKAYFKAILTFYEILKQKNLLVTRNIANAKQICLSVERF